MWSKIKIWLLCNLCVFLGAYAQYQMPFLETSMEGLASFIRMAGGAIQEMRLG